MEMKDFCIEKLLKAKTSPHFSQTFVTKWRQDAWIQGACLKTGEDILRYFKLVESDATQ